MPPGPHLDPPIAIDRFFLCAYSFVQYTRYPPLCIWGQGRRRRGTWHGTAGLGAVVIIYELLYTLHMYTRLCQFCLTDQITVNHAEAGAQISMLLTSICCCNAIHQNLLPRKYIPFFRLPTYPQLHHLHHQTLCPQSSIFSLDDATYYCNGVPARYKVVIIHDGGLSMWHMAPHLDRHHAE